MLPSSVDSGSFSGLENANQFCQLKLVNVSYTDVFIILLYIEISTFIIIVFSPTIRTPA